MAPPPERLCLTCGRMKSVPDGISHLGTPTCKTCITERRRAEARRRYYQRVGVLDGFRLCRWCGLPKEVGVDMTPRGRTCRWCKRERQRASARRTRHQRIARMTEEERAQERVKHAAKARRQRSTREGRARHNAQQKAWREANPEKARAAQKRYRKKMMANPETAAQWRDYQRIYHRIWRERKGIVPHHLSEEEYRNGNGAADFHGRHRFEVGPLAGLISEWLDEHAGETLSARYGHYGGKTEDIVTAAGYNQLAEMTGLNARTLGRIVNGTHKFVNYSTAEAICVTLDTPLLSLYPEAR